MEDIGLHPDAGKPPEYEHEYETRIEYDLICPFCKEDVNEDYDLPCMFLEAIEGSILETSCWNCGVDLSVTFEFVRLASPYTAEVRFEVTASKRVA